MSHSSGQLRFDGRVVIVTGAGMGMGRAHALLFSQRGAKVVVNDINETAAKTVVDEIVHSGGEAVAAVADISNASNAEGIATTAINAFSRIDILVNNAGIVNDAPFCEITNQDWDRMLGVHVHGSIYLTRAVWPHMADAGFGRIIFISSASILGMANRAHYSVAKASLLSLAKTLAVEGQSLGIQANAMNQVGYTPMVASLPRNKYIDWVEMNAPAADVAPPLLWLAHPDCKVSGEFLSAGGKSLARIFMAHTRGFRDLENWSPETVRDHWDEVVSEENYMVPADASTCAVYHQKLVDRSRKGDWGKMELE